MMITALVKGFLEYYSRYLGHNIEDHSTCLAFFEFFYNRSESLETAPAK